jgi:hypothetical protein
LRRSLNFWMRFSPLNWSLFSPLDRTSEMVLSKDRDSHYKEIIRPEFVRQGPFWGPGHYLWTILRRTAGTGNVFYSRTWFRIAIHLAQKRNANMHNSAYSENIWYWKKYMG